MQKFKNALSGIAYHKILGLLIFIIFSASLFILTFIYSLTTVQNHKIKNLILRWKSLNEILPERNNQALQNFIKNNQAVIHHYQEIYKDFLILISITFLIFALVFVLCRKNDILALHQSDIKHRDIILQLLLELYVPIFTSFTLLISILFLFQGNYRQMVASTNNEVYTEQVFQTEITSSATVMKKSPKEQNTTKKRKFLLPFNTHSVFYVDTTESISFRLILRNIIGSFIFLLFLFSLISGALILGYCRFLSHTYL